MITPYSEEALRLAREEYPPCHEIHPRLAKGVSGLASDIVKANLTLTTQLLTNVDFIRQFEPETGSEQSQKADRLLKLHRLLRAEEEAAFGVS